MENSDEIALRTLVAQWNQALENKDAAGLTKDYLSDVVLFDAVPPYKSVGPDAIRSIWEACLPHFPDNFRVVKHDENFVIGTDMACYTALSHFEVPNQPDHPAAESWLRVSVIYRKVEGKWQVQHEHVSLPFNPMTNQAAKITDPQDLMCGVSYC